MILEIGKKYKIILSINNATLTYNCEITEIESPFVSFVDKFGGEYTYNKNLIISIQEEKDGKSN